MLNFVIAINFLVNDHFDHSLIIAGFGASNWVEMEQKQFEQRKSARIQQKNITDDD